jgi:DNA polymerase-3 subunit delta
MIVKSFEIKKIDLLKKKLILFYGQNEGLKDENISKLSANSQNILKYHEKEILDDTENFFNSLFSGSLFDEDKFIIVNQTTDKILKIVEILIEKENQLDNVVILFNANALEKKSKLRSIFEKELICVPYYTDTNETLFSLTQNFLRKKGISISPQNINYLIDKCNGDRRNLNNELQKIEMFSINEKNIKFSELQKLINLSENKGISELIDNCLAKEKNKIINILNENIFTNEDCIVIIRAFLIKTKKILKLITNYQITKNLEETIKNAKPPIFWKDKKIVEKQIITWKLDSVRDLIIDINKLELNIKKNNTNSLNLLSNFILDTST